ncbi:MAG: hypothetical protein BWX99_02979 [Deltaproteobacteria bacterium ADurb.Bin151]|nr:MAG: hypothetical protein BWX99_02979 [Deltaproteobacteria bacterium ADurb.Bin151]
MSGKNLLRLLIEVLRPVQAGRVRKENSAHQIPLIFRRHKAAGNNLKQDDNADDHNCKDAQGGFRIPDDQLNPVCVFIHHFGKGSLKPGEEPAFFTPMRLEQQSRHGRRQRQRDNA